MTVKCKYQNARLWFLSITCLMARELIKWLANASRDVQSRTQHWA